MILSLCIITKGDEELKSLKKAIYSCINYVDAVYVTTNAKKHSKVKEWCSTEPKVEHSHLPWNDSFSEQRNFNFSQVRKDTDYIMWMDSDDVIVGAHVVKDVLKIAKNKNLDAVACTYWYGAKFEGEPSQDTLVDIELEHQRERFFKPGSIEWKMRIHEVPDPIDNANFKHGLVKYSDDFPIAWLHTGAPRHVEPEAMKARMDRNRRLLELELKEQTENGKPDPRTILYLMKIYAESEDKDDLGSCLDLGHEYLQLSGWDQERGLCYQIMGVCAGKLGDHTIASKLFLKAIEEYPYARLPYLYLARAYFNLGNYRAMKHYMDLGASLDTSSSQMENKLEEKHVYLELLTNYFYHAEKDVAKAFKSAEKAYELVPENKNIKERYELLFDQHHLNEASRGAHTIMKYFEDIGRVSQIVPFIKTLPEEMQKLPFCYTYMNKYEKPRWWGDNEICYFANFEGAHFEKWDGNSLKKGIGGSETMVIRMSEELTKLGYKVTVYGDPLKEIEVNGVLYKPWYAFNKKDRFNIFLQWRSSSMVDKINAKKIFIDLHDVFVEKPYVEKIDQIDGIIVKSSFHREYAPNVPDEKIRVISNGIK